MKKQRENSDLFSDPHTQTLRFSELIPRLAELKAQGCLVNHLRFVPLGYEIKYLPPEAARRYRAWNEAADPSHAPLAHPPELPGDSPGTDHASPAPCNKTSDRTPNIRDDRQCELGV